MTHRRSRASQHQSTTSAEAEGKSRHATSPNQGKPPPPNQQEQEEHKHSTCAWQKRTRVDNRNEDKTGQQQSMLALQIPRDDPIRTEPEIDTTVSLPGTERKNHIRPSRSGTEEYTRPINIPKSPFGSERNHYKSISLSGTEQVDIYTSQSQHQSVQSNRHRPTKSLTMILPLFKATTSVNHHGKDILRSQPADSTPPAATYLDSRDAMNDIMTIVGNHEYIDDMAGTSTPIQIRSRPGEVSFFETKTKIISFISPSSQKLLRTILRNMKSPIMMKKYLDAYTLYVGQNTLQVFANFDSDPPITSSRISSTTSSGSLS